MLGSHPLSAILGADVAATSPTQTLRSYVKGLADNGMYLLLCEPYTKFPADYRTPAQKSADAEAERREREENARDNVGTGEPASASTDGEQKARGGVHMATNDVARLRQYITRARKADETIPINLAFEVGRSNVMVVDCDTAEQREAFCEWFAILNNDERLKYTIPTVLSPGEFHDGVWRHRDGGHYYFDAKGVDLPAGSGKMTITHNGQVFDMFWRNRYILIPPSVRKEGAYSRVGPVLTLTDYPRLVSHLLDYGAAQEERLASRGEAGMSPEMVEAVKDWYTTMTWDEILIPAGYTPNRADACGCPTFTRPGGSNPKSVTCHVPGCSNDKFNHDDPPAHFWSTNVEPEILDKISLTGDGGGTISKLQLCAALHFDGDEAEAMRAMNIIPHHGVVAVGGGMFGMSAQVLNDGTVVQDGFDDSAELERSDAVSPAPAQRAVTPVAPSGLAVVSASRGGVATAAPAEMKMDSSAFQPQQRAVSSGSGGAPESRFNVTVAPTNTFSGSDMFGGVTPPPQQAAAVPSSNPFAGVRDLTNASPGSGGGYSSSNSNTDISHNSGYSSSFINDEHSIGDEVSNSPAGMSHKDAYGASNTPPNSSETELQNVTNPVTGNVTGSVTTPVTGNDTSRYDSSYTQRYETPNQQVVTPSEQPVVAVSATPPAAVVAPAPVTDSDTEKELTMLMMLTGKSPEQIIAEAVREYRERHVTIR